jgi:hypothetical protein
MNRWLLTGLCVAGLTTEMSLSVRAEDKEENEVKMKIDDVPAAVKTTIVREADGTAVTSVDKETDEGKTVYEADAKIDGTNYEIKVGDDGKLISKKIDNEDDEKKDGAKKDMKDKD